MKKSFFLVIVFYCFGFSLFAQNSIEAEGKVFGQWDADTVYVIGNIEIPKGEKLLINPGCVVHFNGFFSLSILGSLEAIGNQADSIHFTTTDTTLFHNFDFELGGWNGINLVSQFEGSDSTIFEFCRFNFSKSDTIVKHGGVFYIEDSHRWRISNCHFSNNRSYKDGGAIFLKNTTGMINNNEFSNHHAGNDVLWGYGGVICGVSSLPYIYRNTFRNNVSTGIGGACSFEFTIPTLDANVFEYNFSALGGALGFLRAHTGGLVSNNLIAGNGSTFFGGAIAHVAASPVLANNTIVNNQTIYGGGIYCNEGSNPRVYNSIFWGNVAYAGYGRQVYIIDGESAPEFYHSIFEHGASDFSGGGYNGTVNNCQVVDPQFSANLDNPFQLAQSSPAIDQGQNFIPGHSFPMFDCEGKPRFSNGSVDIGAFEYQWPSSDLVTFLDLKKFLVSYNPKSESISLNFYLNKSENLYLDIFNPLGARIVTYSLGNQNNGEFKQDVHFSRSNGVGLFIARLRVGSEFFSSKFIVL